MELKVGRDGFSMTLIMNLVYLDSKFNSSINADRFYRILSERAEDRQTAVFKDADHEYGGIFHNCRSVNRHRWTNYRFCQLPFNSCEGYCDADMSIPNGSLFLTSA